MEHRHLIAEAGFYERKNSLRPVLDLVTLGSLLWLRHGASKSKDHSE